LIQISPAFNYTISLEFDLTKHTTHRTTSPAHLPSRSSRKGDRNEKIMKILTLTFLTCARKACKASPTSFPLHPRDAELEIADVALNLLFLRNILPRLEWAALRQVCAELGLRDVAEECPAPDDLVEGEGAAESAAEEPGEGAMEVEGEGTERPSKLALELHRVLMETCVVEGSLVCGNCGHEYAVKEGIANFLLPSHLV
jgi:multifunctional methyltransferase subunit TRM112